MNQRNAKLMGHVAYTLVQSGADKPKPPKGSARQVYNHYTNLKRKLKAEWNKKPWNVRYAQRIGIIRTLIASREAGHAVA
jgi:hypothetical protein